MQFRSKGPATTGRHSPRRPPAADRPPSTAWLAAQEAFSAPKPTAASLPVVVVRRARAQEPLDAAGSRAEAPTPAAQMRPARVFRVVGGTAFEAGPDAAAPAEAMAPSASETSPSPRRKRRADTGRRPGPVKIIVEAPSAQVQGPVEAPAGPVSHQAQLETLAAMMGALDAVLGEIAHARGRVFLD